MIDVSGIAKKHGKNFTDWKVKESGYIELVKETLNIENPTFKENLIETKAGNGGYTKIHNKLLVIFARFISTKFAVGLAQRTEYPEKQC